MKYDAKFFENAMDSFSDLFGYGRYKPETQLATKKPGEKNDAWYGVITLGGSIKWKSPDSYTNQLTARSVAEGEILKRIKSGIFKDTD